MGMSVNLPWRSRAREPGSAERASVRAQASKRLAAMLLSLGLLAAPIGSTASGVVLLGQQQITPTADSNPAGSAEAFQATAQASGDVASLSVYVAAGSSASSLTAGLYADGGGTPGSLLVEATLAQPQAGSWNTLDLPSSVAVTAGNVYWIAILVPPGSGTLGFFSTSGGTRSESSSAGDLTTLPGTWTTGQVYGSSPLSAYGSTAGSSEPILSVSPASLGFVAVEGGTDPPAASLMLDNTGGGTLSFTGSAASGAGGWLSLSPTGGTAPRTLQVSAAVGGLQAGSYDGTITITAPGAQGSPSSVPVTLTVTPATSPPLEADWPTYGHDPQRTGNAVGELAIRRGTVADLAPKWSAAVDGKITAQPLFVGGVQVGGQFLDLVIVATANNSVYALDASDGSQVWRTHTGAPSGAGVVPGGFGISGAPTIDRSRGRIYAVTDDGYLQTLALTDGAVVSSPLQVIPDRPDTNLVWSGLTLAGGSVYIATASDGRDTQPWWGRVLQVDASGATPVIAHTFKLVPSIPAPDGGGGIWGYGGVSVDATGRVFAAAAATDTEQYTPYAGRLLALSPDLGLLGSYEPPHPSPCAGDPGVCDMDFGATPIVFQPPGCPTLVAAVNKDGNLYKLNADDLAAGVTTSLQALPLNIAFDGPGRGGLTGVPAYWPAGRMLFVTDGRDPSLGSFGVDAGVVGLSVGAAPSCDLQVAWSVDWWAPGLTGEDEPPSSPTVAGGVVFVGSGSDGSVHAYDAATGSELWNSGSEIVGATFAAPMVANGTLYVGSWDGFDASAGGTVYAFAGPARVPLPAWTPAALALVLLAGGLWATRRPA